ncbi:hypothetical protein ACFSM5_17055 [Lacibacterium aquatile]|uniref:DUF115 domain-containing protein n=1 Tax=Lacibacterium aquatile TaxID=1168082 RepID=A0ABW5DXD3_9PROT
MTDQALALVHHLRGRYPRLPVLLLGTESKRLADVVSHPYPMKFFERRFLKRARVRLVVLAGQFERLPVSLIEKAAWRGCDILAVADAETLPLLESMPWRSRVTRRLVVGEGAGGRGETLYIPDIQALAPAAVTNLVDILEPHLVASKRGRRGTDTLAGGRVRRLNRIRSLPIFGALFERKFRQYSGLAELQATLGNPQSILCLGNGPSSEAPELQGVAYDRLFRVNSSWLQRGSFLKPDFVFTSLSAVKDLSPPAGFMLKTPDDELAMLSALAFAPRVIRYGIAERLGLYDPADFGPYTPTNGAVMLAAAVGLQPAHLIVAGIDLFAHPEGAYPQDGSTVNDYSVGHDRALETRFLLEILGRFKGKLTILSPMLAEAFQRYRASL